MLKQKLRVLTNPDITVISALPSCQTLTSRLHLKICEISSVMLAELRYANIEGQVHWKFKALKKNKRMLLGKKVSIARSDPKHEKGPDDGQKHICSEEC